MRSGPSAPHSPFILPSVLFFWPEFALADLPVHCLRHQILGSWTFFVGPTAPTPQACGHHTPGEVRDVVVQDGLPVAGVLDTVLLEVLLEDPDLASANSTATGDPEVGWWSMVYDQGFEVRLGGRAFFAFSSVLPSPSAADFTSRCGRTAVGWYRELDSDADAWGCYYAVQSARGEVRHGGGSGGGSGRVALVGGSSAAGARVAQQNRSLSSRVKGSRAALDHRPDTLKYAGLPVSWDWRDVDGRNYVPPVRAQASCGACYAIAAVGMLESRLAIASGGRELPSLSVQEVLSCSPYSQGCLGGFPYLVGKYLTDMGVVSEQCFPLQTGEGRPLCGERCDGPSRRWRASDYRYVGGGMYGGCSEVAMMREIHKHGPIVAGFEASSSLYSFSGKGVFSSAAGTNASSAAHLASMVEERTELVWASLAVQQQRDSSSSGNGGSGGGSSATANTAASDSFFERTNHAVLVVGWGVEASTGKKYWWAQNTWGDGWGESGYFRMARGNDDSAFESMAVAVDVDGALPLPISKRLSAAEALEADGDERGSHEAVKAEMRRSAALRRRANRSPFSSSGGANTLTPEDHPPPSPSPRYATVEEPREHGMATSLWGSHDHSLLDAIAHWGYGGG